MKPQAEYLDELRRLSTFARETLPTYGSWSCWDLGMVLVKAALESREPTIKEVSLSLSSAESNVRKYLRSLERDGWIKVRTNPRDSRSSVVTPTHAMIAVYHCYLQMHTQAAQRLLQAATEPTQAEGLAIPTSVGTQDASSCLHATCPSPAYAPRLASMEAND